jgi:hypothetical protein
MLKSLTDLESCWHGNPAAEIDQKAMSGNGYYPRAFASCLLLLGVQRQTFPMTALVGTEEWQRCSKWTGLIRTNRRFSASYVQAKRDGLRSRESNGVKL